MTDPDSCTQCPAWQMCIRMQVRNIIIYIMNIVIIIFNYISIYKYINQHGDGIHVDFTSPALFAISSAQATVPLTFSLLKVRAANHVREVVWNYWVGLFEPPNPPAYGLPTFIIIIIIIIIII